MLSRRGACQVVARQLVSLSLIAKTGERRTEQRVEELRPPHDLVGDLARPNDRGARAAPEGRVGGVPAQNLRLAAMASEIDVLLETEALNPVRAQVFGGDPLRAPRRRRQALDGLDQLLVAEVRRRKRWRQWLLVSHRLAV